jgi:hypothetical protein
MHRMDTQGRILRFLTQKRIHNWKIPKLSLMTYNVSNCLPFRQTTIDGRFSTDSNENVI